MGWDRDEDGDMRQGPDGEEHDNDSPMDGCTTCGGPLQLLGRLGQRNHYRCRNCGIDQSSYSPGGRHTEPPNYGLMNDQPVR